MKKAHTITSMPDLKRPISLAIGTFDGVHLGHAHLIKEMKKLGSCLILTFKNHPSEILTPKKPKPFLTHYKYKVALLENLDVDGLILLSFTKEFASMPYNLFIEELYQTVPFDHLFFGENEAFGSNREGTQDKMETLAKALNFQMHYLPKMIIDNHIVSSSRIRAFIRKGDFPKVEKLLGRPFSMELSISAPIIDLHLLKAGTYPLLLHTPSKNIQIKGMIDDKGELNLPRDIVTNKEHDNNRMTITFLKKE